MVARLVAVALGAVLFACAPRLRLVPPLAPLPEAAYAHYLRGKLAVYESDYPLAVQELRAAAAAATDQHLITVALIEALLKAGHRVEARAEIEAAQRRWPRAVAVWLASGTVYRDSGRLAAARDAYQRAIEIDGASEAAYVGLASTWNALARPDRAEATWRALLRVVPTSIEGHYRLAARLLERNALAEAEPHLRAVLEREPDHIDARLDLGRALRLRGRLDDAVATIRQAFDRAGGPVDLGEELFWLLLETDDRRAALDLLGLLDDPATQPEGRLVLSRLYLTLGEVGAAIHQAEVVRASAPASGEALVAIARARRVRGEGDAAMRALQSVPETSPALPLARALAAEILIERGQPAAALAGVEEARALHPHDSDLVLAHAKALHALGRTADARRILQAAVRARPRSLELLFSWASFEDDAGDPDQAVRLLDRILAVRPDYVAALNFVGFSLADRGRDLARAERLLVQARRLAPGDPYVLDSWGWLLHRRGRQRDAARVLDRAARIAPREPEILFHLGEVWVETGDGHKARAVLERARSLAPPPLKARIDAKLAALRGPR